MVLICETVLDSSRPLSPDVFEPEIRFGLDEFHHKHHAPLILLNFDGDISTFEQRFCTFKE